NDVPRFIDLVLTKGQVHLVVECKRPRDARWVFLVPDSPAGRRASRRRDARAPRLQNEQTTNSQRAIASLADFQVDPACWESSFCAVRGGSERDQPMLDRVCAELTSSTDSIL